MKINLIFKAATGLRSQTGQPRCKERFYMNQVFNRTWKTGKGRKVNHEFDLMAEAGLEPASLVNETSKEPLLYSAILSFTNLIFSIKTK